MGKDDCIFCKIANGEIPSATVYEDSICRVILDVNPANKGHALIIPKEHYDDIYSMDADTASKIFTIATEVAKAQKAELNPEQWRCCRTDSIPFSHASCAKIH